MRVKFLQPHFWITLVFVTAFATIVTVSAVSQYSDEFARRKFWPMTAVPYANDKRCTDLCFNSYEYYKTVEVNCDLMKNGTDTCAGAAIASNDDKAIILTFRGTAGDHQLNEEMNSLWDKVPFPGGGNVSHYFYNAFLTVWNGGVKDDFYTFKNRYPNYEIWITGHSLGGVSVSSKYIF
uniref:Fungal lipase-like domain-containing protein n=1 Tax=Panagrolaimus superbus TaxID=310955 RepID=A0A914Y0P6_9BILA